MSINDSSVQHVVQEQILQDLTFGWIDYSFFITMLSVSGVVGVYFGFVAKKQETTTEYLFGGKTMSYFPVAMSITSSHLSGVSLLGVPAEVYNFGTQYAACVVTSIFTGLVTAYVFLPVFYKLQLTSTFEYLEVRFARPVRQFASVLYTISLVLYIPIVVYGPALAFAQVTGFGLYYITPVICVICIFYTTVGGLKAVVWTDTIQFSITILALFAILVLGIISVGGFGEIWRISGEGGRIVFFDMNPNPFVRSSFWAMALGLTTNWAAGIPVSQGCMQRFLAVPDIGQAKKSILFTCTGLVVIKWVSVYTGLIMYTKYHDCDPVLTHAVSKVDQMFPYHVMDIAGNIPGLPGLFLAALVSAALSSMSGGLNTAAGTIWADFVSPWIPESDTKQRTATRIMKVTVVVLGVLCTGLVFVVGHMGDIFIVTASMQGITSGTIVGLYTLGVLVPWATSRGAVVGGLTGFAVSAWIIVGAQIHKLNGTLHYEPLPTSTDNCPYPLNMTDWTKPPRPPSRPEDEPMILYTISFLYYSLIGLLTVVIFGTVASFLTGSSDLTTLNRDHFPRFIQRFLPPAKYTEVAMVPMLAVPNGRDKEDKETM